MGIINGNMGALEDMYKYRESPVNTNCQSCKKDIVTKLDYETGTCAYCSCIMLAFLGFILGCCLIPLFLKQFKDVIHSCPECKAQVGRFTRMQSGGGRGRMRVGRGR